MATLRNILATMRVRLLLLAVLAVLPVLALTLLAMARFPAVREYDSAACSAFMADLMAQDPLYSNLGAALPNGDVFCTAVPSPVQVNCGGRGQAAGDRVGRRQGHFTGTLTTR